MISDVVSSSDYGTEAGNNATFSASWSTVTDSATVYWYMYNTTSSTTDQLSDYIDTNSVAGMQ